MDGGRVEVCFHRAALLLIAIAVALVACNRQPPTPATPAASPAPPASSTTTAPSTNATDDLPAKNRAPEASAKDTPASSSQATDSNRPAAPPEPSETNKGKESKQAKAKKHDPLFVDWPTPKFVMLVSGQQMGYIEPCGCTGLANQKGGLARRHTLARQLAERGWPVLPVDVGNQVKRFGPQAEIKFQITAEALSKIGYRAVALGADDLRLSVGNLAQTISSDDQSTPFLSANAAVLDPSFTPTHRIVEVGGKKIGVTSVIGPAWQQKIMGSDILLKSPEAGLDEVLPKLREANCDVLVLLAHATIEETQQLAQKYRDFQVVVTAGGLGEPTFQPEPIPDSQAMLVQVGLKGMFVIVLGYFDDPKKPWRYQRVPLDDRFEDSPDMLAMLASYQEQLKTLGLEGLGLKPLPHPTGRAFVGSEKCGECHTKAFEVWQKSGHAHATDSLIHPAERSSIARHFDPECLSCHVTGWQPQQFFPYESGYLSLEKSMHLKGSGCENCHGPGSAHVAAEEGADEAMQKLLRESMRLPLAQAEQKCKECHDLDNSPDFHVPGAFETYWKKVEHKGMD